MAILSGQDPMWIRRPLNGPLNPLSGAVIVLRVHSIPQTRSDIMQPLQFYAVFIEGGASPDTLTTTHTKHPLL